MQSLPKRWALEHNIVESQNLFLHRDGKMRKVVFYIRENRAGISIPDWKAFLNENRVEQGDQCYFSVLPGSQGPITLDVRIVRAKRRRGGGEESPDSDCNAGS